MLNFILNGLGSHSKQALNNIGKKVGLSIHLHGINSSHELRFVHFLEYHKIDVILDVGANKGQFAINILKAGYKGKIISFEPLPEAYEELKIAAEKYGENWTVHEPIALSNKTGMAKFYVTKANTSSSLLKPLDSFISATPIVKVEKHIEVKTEPLDNIIDNLSLAGNVFLKIDVQGSEESVLEGATKSLEIIQGLLIELSFSSLYAEQSLALTVQNKIDKLGFEVWDIWRGYFDPITKQLKQVDALYFRKK